MAEREFARHQRVAAELLRVLGSALRHDVRDPRLDQISLSEVEVTRDLSVARVYFVTANDGDAEDALAALQHAAGFLRSRAGKALRLRAVPELRFQHDDSMATGDRVEQLLARSLDRR